MYLAMKKMIVTTSLCLAFFVLFGFSVYAQSADNLGKIDTTEDTGNEVLDYFNYSNDDLIELVDITEVSFSSGELFSSYDIEMYRSTLLKDLGPLELLSGFEGNRLTTFSSSKAVTGIGEEGAIVGLHVFHLETLIIDESLVDLVVSTQDTLVTLGKSGLYNETVSFDYVGVNYVLLTVEDPITFVTTKRIFKVTLKELETRNKLENMTINFFEEEIESPSIEAFVPEIIDFDF